MSDFRQDFLKFALAQNVLKFGEFTTKAGRQSPYFFNAGLFNDGASTLQLAKFYSEAIIASGVKFDMLFGPAYKGIILAAATAMMLAEKGVNVPFAYNRKEAKDHGEGGVLVGAPLKGRVLIIDDVISAGTSVRESVKLIEAEGATPAAVAIALDRMEKGTGELSAVQEVEKQYGLPVVSIANLNDLFTLLQNNAEFGGFFEPVKAYRERSGAVSITSCSGRLKQFSDGLKHWLKYIFDSIHLRKILMPACSCPHCKTPHWVKDAQLNVAQGFVVCTRCSGMFKAKDYLSGNLPADPAHLPVAVTDVRLVHNIGAQILKHSKLSRKEISDLLNSALKEEPKAEEQAAVKTRKDGFNWTLASLIALTVLIMQLFYLALL